MRALALLLLALVACGPSTRTIAGPNHAMAGPRPEAGPADVAAMRALVAKYSPVSDAILSAYDALPSQFTLGDGTVVTITHSGVFANYLEDGALENTIEYLDTGVHENYHAYASSMGLALQAEAHLPGTLRVEAVTTDGAPMLVRYTAVYPAREMDATFPADAHTTRYRVYVSPSQDDQSTQSQGVFGLLDEWTAYYHGSRLQLDLWPWLRDEAPANDVLLVTYVARLHAMPVAYAEFRLFILHYLLYARDHHPDVYAGLIENQSFRQAFAAVDASWLALLADAAALEPTVHAFARTRGLDAGLAGDELTFDGNPFPIRDAAYPAVVRALASDVYQPILADLARP